MAAESVDGDDSFNRELNAVMNLQRHEAFDENWERDHATISRRDHIRSSLNRSMMNNNNTAAATSNFNNNLQQYAESINNE